VAAPKSLTAPSGAGKSELKKAREYYNARKDGAEKGSYPFSSYKGKDVVEQLELLFCKKCAYCETNYAAVGPVHVEHYRPKAGVAEEPSHCGYWWLASDWTNLLPSCTDCNCERWQSTVEDAPEFAQGERPDTFCYGKGNKFPLKGPHRAKGPRSKYQNEDALLIDPTRRDPELHIGWTIIKDRSFATPLWDASNGIADPHGLTSVQIYGLNRPDLVDARTRVLGDIRLRVNRLRKRIAQATSMTTEDLEEATANLIGEIREVAALAGKDRAYSAAISSEFRSFFDSSIAQLEAARSKLR
jgi:hypothetical protein